jgi:hypothetical protein
MSQKALGRLFNTTPAADGVWINLKRGAGVTFVCFLTGAVGDVYTLLQAKDSGGTGSKSLPIVTEYWTNTGNGSDAWVRQTQAAGNVVTTTATAAQNALVIEVEGTSLDDAFTFVKLTSTGAGTVNAVTRDLTVQRTPANLPAMAS